MFSERFDALMNIAEVSNSLLGRVIHMNPSYIGRLRSGARPLPKKHGYLPPLCAYLANHIKKDYQVTALRQLLKIDADIYSDPNALALYLEQWLLEKDIPTSAATNKLISTLSQLNNAQTPAQTSQAKTKYPDSTPVQFEEYLFGNEGKRKAVEQFFIKVLQEDSPQTLLLFSDESMEWLYEDEKFTTRWSELFAKVIANGNRVRIVHTISRDINEMLEAVSKWLPIYLTGMVEPYFYPRIRDGVFQRTLFVAPKNAAVASSSVQQDTSRMLNQFITDPAAVEALRYEYERYFALCRPLMIIIQENDSASLKEVFNRFSKAKGDAVFCCSMPPAFTLPENLARELLKCKQNEGADDEDAWARWKESSLAFSAHLQDKRILLLLKDPAAIQEDSDLVHIPGTGILPQGDLSYTRDQYLMHLAHLKELEKRCDKLCVTFRNDLIDNMALFIKEEGSMILIKKSYPQVAFVIDERNIKSAFWDYFTNMTQS